MYITTAYKKQIELCDKYSKKCDFWCHMTILPVIFCVPFFLLNLGYLLVLGSIVLIYLPTFIRLYQYSRAVSKLGEL